MMGHVRPDAHGPGFRMPCNRKPDRTLRATSRRGRLRSGRFAAVGKLLAHAVFTGAAGSASGADVIEEMLRASVIVYEDGTPRTKHVVTNIVIEVDAEVATASASSYFTVLQALPDLPLQIIVSGRYLDRFEQHDGQWRFADRRVRTDRVGDVSRHLRRAASDP